VSAGEASDDPDAADFWVPEWADEAKKLRRRKGISSPRMDDSDEGSGDNVRLSAGTSPAVPPHSALLNCTCPCSFYPCGAVSDTASYSVRL
jgi:hypothetical protein